MDVKIEAVGEKGDGIAKKDGFVIFIPNAKEGDTVNIKITRVLKKMAFAELTGNAAGTVSTSSTESRRKAPVKEEEPEEVFDTSNDSEDFGEEDESEDSLEEIEDEVKAE